MKRRLLCLAASVLACAAIAGTPVAPASAGPAAWVGACPLNLMANSTPLGLVPGPATITLNGGGTCVTQKGTFTMTLSHVVLNPSTPLGFGCLAGIAAGVGTVSLSDPSFSTLTVQFTAVNVGGVVALVGVSNIITFDGAAGFVINPTDLANCGGMTTSTWTGLMLFQDPVLT
jgi:hypothetical protein